MEGINPLTTPQQRLLQNVLASHVSTDSALRTLWDEIRQTSSNNEYLGRDLNDTLCIINRSLKPAFGLEIRSVSLALSSGGDNGNDEDQDSDRPQLYHAIVNCQADKVSKAAGNPDMTKNPHELALFRLIIERLVEMSNDDDRGQEEEEEENNNNDGSARKRNRSSRMGTGCQAALSDMAMINMRTELTGAHAGKLSIEQVQNMLELFVSQGWFVSAADPNGNGSREKTSTPNSSSRKKKKTRNLQLGPRAYLEFADFLRKAGMDQELLPQFLVHA
jgi:hypothetical protein